GTQCDRIVKKYGFTHLSSGDLLRAEVQSGSARGKELTAIMEKGDLVPLVSYAQEFGGSKGFLIDGYPREIDQGKEFEKQICPCTKIIYFEVSDSCMTERLLNRAKSAGPRPEGIPTQMRHCKNINYTTKQFNESLSCFETPLRFQPKTAEATYGSTEYRSNG
ncbi:putative adenylate kinase isoenzyme F38B24, partial [Caligus rogercresseyi]